MQRITPKPEKETPWYVRWLLRKQKNTYGQELESAKIWARIPRLFLAISALYGALERKKSPIDPTLRSLLIVFVSRINSCAFCIDLNTSILLKKGITSEKLSALNTFAKSGLFNDKEKIALTYAEAMTHTNLEVTDEMAQAMKQFFSDDEIVEITAIIAFQNCSTKFNSALGIDAQGFCSTKES